MSGLDTNTLGLNAANYLPSDCNIPYKLFCALILLVSAAISAYLTVTFMHSLGEAIGMATVFAVAGLTLDLVKTASPALMTRIRAKSLFTTLALGMISLALILLSATASVFSLQSGVESALQSSKAAQIAQHKVDALQVEITDLQQLQRQQLDANYITAANNTQSLISARNAELQTLLDDTVAVDDGSLLASFSDYIVLIIAGALEVVSVVMTLCLHHLGTNGTRQDDAGHRGTMSLSQLVVAAPDVETQDEPGQSGTTSLKTAVSEEVCPELWDEQDMDNVTLFPLQPQTTQEQVLENMKCQLRSGAIKPTHRDVYEAFRHHIRKSDVANYLSILAQRNILVQDGRSYRVA